MDTKQNDAAAQENENKSENKRKKVNKIHLIVIGVCTLLIILLSFLAYRQLSEINVSNEYPQSTYSVPMPPKRPPQNPG